MGLWQYSCVFSLYTSRVFGAHVTNNSIYPSVSGHPVCLSNICLSCRSPSARELPASLLSLDLTLDPPCEGTLSVPLHVPCVSHHQPLPSQPRLSRRPSSHSSSRFCRFRFESRTRSLLLPLRLPRFQSQNMRTLQSTFNRPSRLQSYWRPSRPSSPFGASRGSKR